MLFKLFVSIVLATTFFWNPVEAPPPPPPKNVVCVMSNWMPVCIPIDAPGPERPTPPPPIDTLFMVK